MQPGSPDHGPDPSFEPNIVELIHQVQWGWESSQARYAHTLRTILAACDSPAERLFLLMFVKLWDEKSVVPIDLLEGMDEQERADSIQEHPAVGRPYLEFDVGFHGFKFELHPQQPVVIDHERRGRMRYRLDFLGKVCRAEPREGEPFERWSDLRLVNKTYSEFAIEIDGHPYHDRTKEQASRDRLRDRSLLGEGIQVIRFTASDLFRDPEAVTGDTVDTVTRELTRVIKSLD